MDTEVLDFEGFWEVVGAFLFGGFGEKRLVGLGFLVVKLWWIARESWDL